MSEIVSSVLKSTFGFLANKIRKEVANRLKDGDVTDEECRRLIVRELDDIKSKLDGLARKDLLSSLCFLQEGVNGLYQSLLQFPSNENTAESTEPATLVEDASSRDTGSDSPINDAVALINAVSSLKICSNERLKSAVESFKLAREKATEAFCNEALSIEDRIQASQIRMMARILEKLDDPDAAVSDCLQYLKQVHDLGAVQEIFSVLIDGGLKSRFNQAKRLDNASSVYMVNQILFEFAKKLTKLSMVILAWPTISLGKGILYHPVLGEESLASKLKESGVQVMSSCPDFTFGSQIDTLCSVLNSKGEIVAPLLQQADTFIKINRSGESRTLCKVPREEDTFLFYVIAMDIDAEDNIHVITAFRKSVDNYFSFELHIYDANGNKKLAHPLAFHHNSILPLERIAISKDGQIAILDCRNEIVYIGRVEVNSFTIDKSFSLSELLDLTHTTYLRYSYLNGTEIIVANGDRVYIYSENGELERQIKIPKKQDIRSVAINHVTKRILIKTGYSSHSLLSFSETGELIDSLCLGSSEWMENAHLTSHPSGAVALVGETGAAFLQLQ